MKELEKRFWFKTEGSLALQANCVNPNKLLMMPLPEAGSPTSFADQLNPPAQRRRFNSKRCRFLTAIKELI